MKKEVKLYKFAWTNSHNGRRYRENAEIELVETNAIETEKQYQIHHDHGNGNLYIQRINKCSMKNGVWKNPYRDLFIGVTKDAVIDEVISYYNDEIYRQINLLSSLEDVIRKAKWER